MHYAYHLIISSGDEGASEADESQQGTWRERRPPVPRGLGVLLRGVAEEVRRHCFRLGSAGRIPSRLPLAGVPSTDPLVEGSAAESCAEAGRLEEGVAVGHCQSSSDGAS